MANTYTQIYIQLIFAVSGRINVIRGDVKEELYKYIAGIIRNENHKLIVINGMPDHIHILIGMKPHQSISDLVRNIKSNSSRFMNEKGWFGGKFFWQQGFGAFSYSHSQLNGVCRYIENQEKHHMKKSFADEYIDFLRKFDVDYDAKYIFKSGVFYKHFAPTALFGLGHHCLL